MILSYLLHGAESLRSWPVFAANQEIPRILWNPKVLYRIQKTISNFFFRPTSVYLISVGVEGYCCPWFHSVSHTTLGRTPLDEGSMPVAETSIWKHNICKGQISMSLAGFEPAIPESERRQSYALNFGTTGTGSKQHVGCHTNGTIEISVILCGKCNYVCTSYNDRWALGG
jgi:hypothetical protein